MCTPCHNNYSLQTNIPPDSFAIFYFHCTSPFHHRNNTTFLAHIGARVGAKNILATWLNYRTLCIQERNGHLLTNIGV